MRRHASRRLGVRRVFRAPAPYRVAGVVSYVLRSPLLSPYSLSPGPPMQPARYALRQETRRQTRPSHFSSHLCWPRPWPRHAASRRHWLRPGYRGTLGKSCPQPRSRPHLHVSEYYMPGPSVGWHCLPRNVCRRDSFAGARPSGAASRKSLGDLAGNPCHPDETMVPNRGDFLPCRPGYCVGYGWRAWPALAGIRVGISCFGRDAHVPSATGPDTFHSHPCHRGCGCGPILREPAGAAAVPMPSFGITLPSRWGGIGHDLRVCAPSPARTLSRTF